MSTLSKIFVVLNLVLSILFATFVTYFFKYAQNWHQQFDDKKAEMAKEVQKHKADVDNANEEITSLKKDVVTLRDTIGTRDAEIARLNTENTRLGNEKRGEEAKNVSLVNQLDRLTAESARKSEENKQLHAEIENNRKSREDAVARMEQAVDAAHEWELQSNEKDTMLLALRERITKISKDLQERDAVLQEMAHQGIPVERYASGALPKIEGRVTGVLSGVVMISIGSDDQVREGYEFSVARGEHYLCKIRIDKVFQDEAAGEIIPSSLPPEAGGKPDVRVNDYVSTRF